MGIRWWQETPSPGTLRNMGSNGQQSTRSINVTGLSDEAIRAIESLVGLLRERGGGNETPEQIIPDPMSFELGLDELLEGLPSLNTLPDDFTRADIYGEHP